MSRRYSDTHCACGMYLPASVRKAGKDECGNCERERLRAQTANDRLVALIDAVDGTVSCEGGDDDVRAVSR